MQTKFTEYTETLQFLYDRLPAFQHSGSKAIKPNVKNILGLCRFLGEPQTRFKSIHVAGTNGKGSSSHYLASIFQEAGLKTGLYTSPHLKNYTERFRINGQEAPKKAIVDFINLIAKPIEEFKPSFFEVSVAFAFYYFAKEKVDIAIIEVGLGGRFDSTNIILPELCLISNIGLDHQKVLGNTLAEIAAEKAGIIKENVPVVVSEVISETKPVFIEFSERKSAELLFAQEECEVIEIKPNDNYLEIKIRHKDLGEITIESELRGSYQSNNILGVLTLINKYNSLGRHKIKLESIKNGFKNVVKNTNLKGRWQKLGEQPLVICDTAHNVPGIQLVLGQLKEFTPNKMHFILGFVKDKDVNGVLKLFPEEAKFYFSDFNSPRAIKALELQKLSLNRVEALFENVNEAIKEVIKIAKKDEVIYVGGSTYLVAEINNL